MGFYLMMHTTHVLQLYDVRYVVKDHSDSERGNPLLSLHGLLFLKNELIYTPKLRKEGRVLFLMMHLTHFIYHI